MIVNVTGNQWWWDVQYTTPATCRQTFRTANELHLPVGVPVR